MARIMEAVLDKEQTYNNNTNANPLLDLRYGAQGGPYARIGGIDKGGIFYDEWVSNHAYVRGHIIPILLTYPRFMDFMPNKDKLIETLKVLVECRAKSIDGLNTKTSVVTAEHPVGNNDEQQEEITNVKRERSSITKVYQEVAGKSIQRFWDTYIHYGIMHPDLKRPLVTQYMEGEDIRGLYTPDFYSFSTLYIEPDMTQKLVIDAWLVVNMYPKESGDRIGKREQQGDKEIVEYSIPFSGITLNNDNVIQLGQEILDGLTFHAALPEDTLVNPVKWIDSPIEYANVGYDRN